MEIGLLALWSGFDVLGTGMGMEGYWYRLYPWVYNVDEFTAKQNKHQCFLEQNWWSAFTFLTSQLLSVPKWTNMNSRQCLSPGVVPGEGSVGAVL